MTNKKVLLAMSGGLDSSVSAHLLKEKGYDVEGITLVFHEDVKVTRCNLKICCSSDDVVDAAEICSKLGIPHHTLNLSETFERKVVMPFIDEYRLGKTPNPCGRCNRFLKVGFLADLLPEYEADLLATGHYCRIIDQQLYKGRDASKDQSYFLSMVKQSHIEKMFFPLGDMTKDESRDFARERGLKVAEKKESQELCFTGGRQPKEFVRDRIQEKTGFIRHVSGAILKSHNGLSSYTIGQRKGLGISWSEPLYVVSLDYKSSTVYVGEKSHLERKLPIKVSRFNQLSPFLGELSASIRYNQTPMSLDQVTSVSDTEFEFVFSEPVSAVAPGQMLVVYSGDRVVGGGIIES